MNRKLTALLLTVLLAFPVLMPSALANRVVRYVYTENGKSLNVRAAPRTDAAILGTLPFGTELTIEGYTSDYAWATIVYSTTYGEQVNAYVMTRFLVDYYPGRSPYSPTPAPKSDTDRAVAEMEAEMKTYKPVSVSYVVLARPARSSGWVNLRVAPTTAFGHMENCYNGKQLSVVAETRNWFQVQDPTNGMVGYISRQYVTVMGVGAYN